MKKTKTSSLNQLADQSPIGFLSYVRDDDKHEHGRLTEFAERLSGEVRMQTGEKFSIFQDRNSIAWGQQWKVRIDESIDSATFLIAIITPAFFMSPQCCDELERFLEREKRLRRGDLVLPVYYVDCPILNDERKRKTEKLAEVIAERQNVDWRELRFEPFTSPQIGKTLAKMATQIVDALERGKADEGKPKVISKSPNKKKLPGKRSKITKREVMPAKAMSNESTRAGSTTEQLRTESSGQPADEGRGPSAKTEPPTLVVDALHRGDHPSLTAALAAAQPGHRILVRAGLYQEGVVIDKPVEIIGDGELGDVVIEATGNHAVLFKASMGRLANLTLRQAGGGMFYCVDITQGRLELEGCDITSQSLACVAIHGGADPRLRRNRIHDGKSGGGVYVYTSGQGTLEDNDIFANAFAGVEIKEESNPILRRNRIHDGRQTGIMVGGKSQGILEDNDIFANALSGVEIKEDSNPILRRNRIHDGKSSGIFVHTNGQGTVEENDIFANAFAGVEIKQKGNPILRRNRIHDGKSTGIYVHTNGQGTLEDNDIFNNYSSGVQVKEGGKPTLRRNRISENNSAIKVLAGGQGTFEDNDLRENLKGAWDIAADCTDKITRARNKE